jgi:hypothetical protein
MIGLSRLARIFHLAESPEMLLWAFCREKRTLHLRPHLLS